MKQMSRDPLAATKARRAEEKLGAITIKPLSLAPSDTKSTSGFKKGGFKNAFGNVNDDGGEKEKDEKKGRGVKAEVKVEGFGGREVEVESGSEEVEDAYDPRRPSGCGEGCPGRI